MKEATEDYPFFSPALYNIKQGSMDMHLLLGTDGVYVSKSELQNYFCLVWCDSDIAKELEADRKRAQEMEAQKPGGVKAISAGASVAVGIAVSGTLMWVWDTYGDAGLAVSAGFGGGVGSSIAKGSLKLEDLGSIAPWGMVFDDLDRISELDGPGIEIGCTIGIFNAAYQTNGESDNFAIGFGKEGLEFHAMITGTKLLFKISYSWLMGMIRN